MGSEYFDGTVVEEMARRLRAADLWDNNLSDGLAFLSRKMQVLEELSRYKGFAFEQIKRPLESYADARKLLVVIASSRTFTFTEQPATIPDCLGLAVLLYQWEQAGHPCPADIRVMFTGTIALEWSKPACSVLLDKGAVFGPLPWDKSAKAKKGGVK